MITENAKKKVNLFLQTFFTTGNVGVGGDTTNPNANVLDVPLLTANESLTVTNTGDTSTDFKLSVMGSQLAASAVREFGVFGTLPEDNQFTVMQTEGVAPDSSNGTEASTETTMLARFPFEALGPFNNSDQIDITLSVEVE
tara:strand:- start:637 stop:1059 length:423 start_codon:yes stop_codon:yes gene_type:complete